MPWSMNARAQRLGAGIEVVGIRRRKLGVDALVGSTDVALAVEHLVEGFRVAIPAEL